MKRKFMMLCALALSSTFFVSAQQTPPNYPPADQEIRRLAEPVEKISRDLAQMTKSVDALTRNLSLFFEKFSSNQGLQLTERQQKLLFSFEILNRSEQRLATLQKLKLDLSEKQSSLRLQIASVTDDLLPESIDRYVSTRGTTNAEQIREIRRQALSRERAELGNLLSDVQRGIQETDSELRQIEMFLRTIRMRIFREIEREVSDL